MPAIENLAERAFLTSNTGPNPAFRLAPHNIEAEQAPLGAIRVNNDAFDRVSDFLKADHFSEEVHRRIVNVAAQLIRPGTSLDHFAPQECAKYFRNAGYAS